MPFTITIIKKLSLAYSAACKPLCKELGIPQTAFDILLFLGNNPVYKTAGDITEIRHIKANLVSVNVERLVQDGYLTRRPVKGDRRKTELLCTQKALPVIERGRLLQHGFSARLLANMDDHTHSVLATAMDTIEKNLDEILKTEEAK